MTRYPRLARRCVIPIPSAQHVEEVLNHLVGRGDDAGIGRISLLGDDQLGELVGDIGVGALQRGADDLARRPEDCRAGFVVRSGKRLKTIRVGTQGPTLTGHAQGDFDRDGNPDFLDRAYQFEYLNYAGTNSHWSLLAKVTPIGADGTSTLPSSSFGYAVSDPPDVLSAADRIIGATNEPPYVMNNPLVELLDLNGDGLPDIIKTEQGGGAHRAYLNRGEVQMGSDRVIQWDPPIDVDPGNGTAWNYYLSSSDTHLADMDGDGLADLVHKLAPSIGLGRCTR